MIQGIFTTLFLACFSKALLQLRLLTELSPGYMLCYGISMLLKLIDNLVYGRHRIEIRRLYVENAAAENYV